MQDISESIIHHIHVLSTIEGKTSFVHIPKCIVTCAYTGPPIQLPTDYVSLIFEVEELRQLFWIITIFKGALLDMRKWYIQFIWFIPEFSESRTIPFSPFAKQIISTLQHPKALNIFYDIIFYVLYGTRLVYFGIIRQPSCFRDTTGENRKKKKNQTKFQIESKIRS